MQSFGKRVYELRTERDWDRKMLAQRMVKVDPSRQMASMVSMIGNWERGERGNPKGDLLQCVADAFGITVSELIGDTDNENYEAVREGYESVFRIAYESGITAEQLMGFVNLLIKK